MICLDWTLGIHPDVLQSMQWTIGFCPKAPWMLRGLRQGNPFAQGGRGLDLELAQVFFQVPLAGQIRRFDVVVVNQLQPRNTHGRKLQRHLPADGADANNSGFAGSKLSVVAEEIRALRDEFGDVEFNWDEKALCAVTEPITLEEVYLGRFRIALYIERLGDLYHQVGVGFVALVCVQACFAQAIAFSQREILGLDHRNRLDRFAGQQPCLEFRLCFGQFDKRLTRARRSLQWQSGFGAAWKSATRCSAAWTKSMYVGSSGRQ